MATQLNIPGPTVVEVRFPPSDTWVLLGRTDNDNLPSVQIQDTHKEIKSILSGDMPAEVILTGTTAKIAVALVEWDLQVLTDIFSQQRGTGNAVVFKDAAKVGRRLIQQGGTFELRIKSESQNMYLRFPAVYFSVDSMQDSQWGNRERVITLQFTAIPESELDLLYSEGYST